MPFDQAFPKSGFLPQAGLCARHFPIIPFVIVTKKM